MASHPLGGATAVGRGNRIFGGVERPACRRVCSGRSLLRYLDAGAEWLGHAQLEHRLGVEQSPRLRTGREFLSELVAQVPDIPNGGIKTVAGDEVITFHLKPDPRWSDGSGITSADYFAALLEASSPEAPGSAVLALLSSMPQGGAPEPGNYCPLR